jgi:hypothetical protein
MAWHGQIINTLHADCSGSLVKVEADLPESIINCKGSFFQISDFVKEGKSLFLQPFHEKEGYTPL